MRDQRTDVSLNIAPEERLDSREVRPRSFRMLVMGDFSAAGDARASSVGAPQRVDRDNLDTVLRIVAPRVRVATDDAVMDLAFADMDDFHPDRLLQRLPERPSPPPAAARPEAGEARPASPAAAQAPSPSSAARDLDPSIAATALAGGSLLDDMLAATADSRGTAGEPHRSARPDELAAFVERVVAPHLVRPPDPVSASRAASAAHETARLLRSILHHPPVQALEAAWRAVEMLVRRLDTDGDLQLFVLDVDRDHVADALERLAQRRDATEDEPWALAVSLHAFPDGDGGAEALAGVAIAARELGVACVAAAPAAVAGQQATAFLDDGSQPSAPPEVYALIRQSLEARNLGLTFPRVLLRAPYGRDNPCDAIDLEEIEDPERHEDFLWGSGATYVALLVGEAFLARGWDIGRRISLDVGSLPFFTYRRGGETVATSCAEIVMSERTARHLLTRGIMPLAWIKGTDRVRLVELMSVADPPAPLAATWAGSR